MKTIETDIEKITKKLEEEGCRVLTEEELRLKVTGGWGSRSSSSSSSTSSSSSSGRSSGSSSRRSSSGSGSKSSSKNSSASSKKSSSGESGTTKTKTSVGQAIKNFAEKYASSNWQKNNPDFGIHSSSSSSSSSYGNSYTFGESSYSNGTKGASRDSETTGKSSENSIKQTSSSSSQKPKTYNKESFAKKNGEKQHMNKQVGRFVMPLSRKNDDGKSGCLNITEHIIYNEKTEIQKNLNITLCSSTPKIPTVDKKATERNFLEQRLQSMYPSIDPSSNTDGQDIKYPIINIGSGGGSVQVNPNTTISTHVEENHNFNPFKRGPFDIDFSRPEGSLFSIQATTPVGTGEIDVSSVTFTFKKTF